MIHLYDTSAMLYIGDSVTRPADDFVSEKLKGLPVRGIRYTLEKLITEQHNTFSEVYAVMDSRTNKNEYYPDYKSQRTPNRDVFVQRELLKYLLPRLGIPMIIQDNMEADDLFYCFIIDKYVKHIKEPYKGHIPNDGIWLHCDDRDLLGCLLDVNIQRVGLKSSTPTVTTANYEAVLSKNGYYVTYNSVLPHELFYGKTSNNLKKISSCDPTAVYFDYLSFCDNQNIDKSRWSLENLMNMFLKYAQGKGMYSDDFYKEIKKRMPVVYPRLSWNNNAIIRGKLDKKFATNFLSLFQERHLCQLLGVPYKSPEEVPSNILDYWISMYRSGVVDVDNFITPDSTFFFSDTSSSGNIGGF